MLKFKKCLSISLALATMTSMALAIPSFAATTNNSISKSAMIGTAVMPRINIFSNTAYSTNGSWSSEKFSATKDNGKYIRFWHDNTTGEKVAVYLYRVDSGKTKKVASMKIGAHSGKSAVYSDKDSGSGTYYIKIEAYESGGLIDGTVSVAQYDEYPTD